MSEPRIGIDDVDGSARQVQIPNTKGHVNGWTAVENVVGRLGS